MNTLSSSKWLEIDRIQAKVKIVRVCHVFRVNLLVSWVSHDVLGFEDISAIMYGGFLRA